MTTLTIKDLAAVEELDRKAMAAVHGGKSISDTIVDTAKAVWYVVNHCEVSSTGKSFVCY
jgi:hypothetical protein